MAISSFIAVAPSRKNGNIVEDPKVSGEPEKRYGHARPARRIQRMGCVRDFELLFGAITTSKYCLAISAFKNGSSVAY